MPTNRFAEHWSASTPRSAVHRCKEENEEVSQLAVGLQSVERFLIDHPQLAIVSALAVGLALGWLGKRK